MPANLTPDYERAENRYRAATTDDQRLDALREMFATIPKHKGTEKLQADLKHRISELRKAVAHKPKTGGTDLYHVPRGGAAQIVLVGPPNVGKSLLVGKTTHAPVKVADYPFSTALPVPGMAWYHDVQIELVDTPPVTAEHIPGTLLGTIRAADIIALVADGTSDPLEQADMLLTLLEGRGLKLRSARLDELDPADAADHCAMLLVNKVDLLPDGGAEVVLTLRELYAGRLQVHGVSAMTGEGVENVLARLWELLALIRVYTREPGQHGDPGKPFVLDAGATVEDLGRAIHRELPGKIKFARLWRMGRPEGLQVHHTEPLHDKDIVEIHE